MPLLRTFLTQARTIRWQKEGKEVSTKTAGAGFEPNEFYERLIVLRETQPSAFARFSSVTLAALKAYEEAKHKAGDEKEGGRK
jgi:hypothetical protein